MENKNIVRILGMAGFVVVADNWVVASILPAIASDLHTDIANAGLLITAYMAPFAFSQLLFGPLADRIGKKQVITCAILGFTIATGLNALGFGLKSLAFCRAMTGFSVAVVMGGRLSGKLAGNLGPRHVLTLGILSAAVALFVLAFFGAYISVLITAILLLGFGFIFIFTYSILITRTTEFGRESSGAAMSLCAFTFMIAGALGTAAGSAIISCLGISILFFLYAAALLGVWALSLLLYCSAAPDGVYEA